MNDKGMKTTVTRCVICGDELNMLSEARVGNCDFCGKQAPLQYECQSMHSICYDCASMSSAEFIKSYCLAYKGTDPISLAIEIMNSPFIEMHGAWHHFVVPAVLLSVVKNLSGKPANLSDALDMVEHRVESEVPVECAFSAGTCGAACGAAAFLSVYLDRDPESEDMWSLTNELTTRALKKIKEYLGPPCCKRDTYLTIYAVAEFMSEKFAIEMPLSKAQCTFSLRNRDCGREDCFFFNLANVLV